MDENVKKHLHDILDAINEIESFFGDKPKYFNEFCNDLYPMEYSYQPPA